MVSKKNSDLIKAFEKSWAGGNEINGELCKLLLEVNNKGEYVNTEVNKSYGWWVEAWNASHDRCIKLCLGYVPTVTINDCREDKIRGNIKSACASVIKKDKVK